MTGTGGTYSVHDINKISAIPELRECYNIDYVYNVYEVDDGRLFLFYEINHRIPYFLSFYCYEEKLLSKADFDNIELGIADIDDIKKIDQPTGFIRNIFFNPKRKDPVKYNDYSTHTTKDGIISIGYTEINGKLIVSYIEEHIDYRIAKINPLDLKQ